MKLNIWLLAGPMLCAGLLTPVFGLTSEHSEPSVMQANGTFDVKISPQQADNADAEAVDVARMSMSKSYQGALEARAHGEMLAFGDGVRSGAYVALEQVNGALEGRHGSFALVHHAVMRQGVPEAWTVTIVPDSGSGELNGIEGTMRIDIVDGEHFYELNYTLP